MYDILLYSVQPKYGGAEMLYAVLTFALPFGGAVGVVLGKLMYAEPDRLKVWRE